MFDTFLTYKTKVKNQLNRKTKGLDWTRMMNMFSSMTIV